MYIKINGYIFSFSKTTIIFTNKTKSSHCITQNGLAQNCNKSISVKGTSFANSPPNQMSHCLQWGSDWKAREGSDTSLVVCSRWKVIFIRGRLRCCRGGGGGGWGMGAGEKSAATAEKA